MSNILDYLDWRGDLSFEQSEFNEVDNLLLSQLPYINFEGIVKDCGIEDSISIEEASRIFFSQNDEDELLNRVSMTKNAIFVLKKMAESNRFSNARLFGYREEISEQEQSQFSVVSVQLGDGSVYVSFSGTDETIVGWREDFNMTYLDELPGQKKAVAYVCEMDFSEVSVLRLGGHSKGGNLAIYAGINCNPEVKNKIVKIYNNDGPGFSKETVESDLYQNQIQKIHTIMPESSIVGILLEHSESYTIVKSTNHGLKQHDALSWVVLGTTFVEAEQVSKNSLLIDGAMKNWLAEMDSIQRQELVETAFQILDAADIKTVDDLYSAKWNLVMKASKAVNELPEDTKKMMSEAIKKLIKSVISVSV